MRRSVAATLQGYGSPEVGEEVAARGKARGNKAREHQRSPEDLATRSVHLH